MQSIYTLIILLILFMVYLYFTQFGGREYVEIYLEDLEETGVID